MIYLQNNVQSVKMDNLLIQKPILVKIFVNKICIGTVVCVLCVMKMVIIILKNLFANVHQDILIIMINNYVCLEMELSLMYLILKKTLIGSMEKMENKDTIIKYLN